jgi:hypothetical protein
MVCACGAAYWRQSGGSSSFSPHNLKEMETRFLGGRPNVRGCSCLWCRDDGSFRRATKVGATDDDSANAAATTQASTFQYHRSTTAISRRPSETGCISCFLYLAHASTTTTLSKPSAHSKLNSQTQAWSSYCYLACRLSYMNPSSSANFSLLQPPVTLPTGASLLNRGWPPISDHPYQFLAGSKMLPRHPLSLQLNSVRTYSDLTDL